MGSKKSNMEIIKCEPHCYCLTKMVFPENLTGGILHKVCCMCNHRIATTIIPTIVNSG